MQFLYSGRLPSTITKDGHGTLSMSMSPNRFTQGPESFLRAILWTIALSIFGISIVIMRAMDESSRSQGGPFYVAVIAILLLGAVESQLRRMMRRRLPFSLATLPEERRYALHSLVLLSVASVLLLGVALYLTVGLSPQLLRIVAYVLALIASPFVVAFLLSRLARRPLERGIDWLFGRSAGSATTSRTFTFSFGSPPAAMASGRASPVPQPAMAAERAEHYRRAWQRIRELFDAEPAQAVTDAHELIVQLCTETGHAGAFVDNEEVVISDLADLRSSLGSVHARVRASRDASRAVRSVLSRQSARLADLERAMTDYERTLVGVLDSTDAGR